MNDQKSIENIELIGNYQDSIFACYNEPAQLTEAKIKNTFKQLSTTNQQLLSSVVISHQKTVKQGYELPPLILDGVNLSRVALNNFLVTKIPKLKCNNTIYIDKRKMCTIYPSTIASYSALLTRLSMNELSDFAKILTPRSIQRIQKLIKKHLLKM
ncbi:unnamed protein product [Adineta steineri]|uniref:Uncharacterized protein n=1 Tax=Adineta steineri TaxID=433720 RepID=A0A815UTE1_9BILA|nr:unnamed protein product [Adineta steineri]CAF4251857.1 unnamed protein product [Adineta steineri]